MSEKDMNQTLFNMAAVATVRDIALQYQGREYIVTKENTPFVIGRDKSCNLQIDNAFTSRAHCKILFHNKNFIIKDSSTNGTYVRLGLSQPIQLSDSLVGLSGSGVIKLGQAIQIGDKDVIEFKARA